MGSLDFHHIHEPSTAAHEHSTREGKVGDREVALRVESTRAIRNALTALQKLSYLRVQLHPLEFLIGVQIRILVVEPNNESNVDQIRLHVVQKRTPIDRGV